VLGQGLAPELVVADHVHGLALGKQRVFAAVVGLAQDAARTLIVRLMSYCPRKPIS
jgi:hypothetical protein